MLIEDTVPHDVSRPKLEGGKRIVMHTEFSPAGDQPTAIKELVSGINEGEQNQVLLGATGTGKTFTMAKVIEVGFNHAEKNSELWRNLGTSLARLRLLQGNWGEMNAVLHRLGEAPIREEDRATISAPPRYWATPSGCQMRYPSCRNGR